MTRVCVVGNGPSLEGAGLGKVIDTHDVVVRMHDWHWQLRADYHDSGFKYTVGVIPGPWAEAAFLNIEMRPDVFWMYKPRKYWPMLYVCGVPLHNLDCVSSDYWDEIVAEGFFPTRGYMGVIMASKVYGKGTITLAGFDSLQLGFSTGYSKAYVAHCKEAHGWALIDDTGVTYNARHNFTLERDLLKKHLGDRLEFLPVL